MNKRIESIQIQIEHFNQTIAKMDAAIAKVKGEDKDILTAQRAALASYVDDLQGIVDTYGKD